MRVDNLVHSVLFHAPFEVNRELTSDPRVTFRVDRHSPHVSVLGEENALCMMENVSRTLNQR